MPVKRSAAKRRQRKKAGDEKLKLDPKIFTDPVERAAAEAMLEKSVNDYGNDLMARLVEHGVKRGEIAREKGEKIKAKFARQFNNPKQKGGHS
jgi:hypothetical protein